MSHVENSISPVPLSHADQVKDKILRLRTQLQEKLPGYESLLHEIHRALAKDESTAHLLTEEEIGVICLGLQKRAGSYILEKEASKKTKTGKVTLDDI